MSARVHRGIVASALASGLLACAPAPLRATDVPADVAWIGMLVEDDAAHLLTATPLRPYDAEAKAALAFRPGSEGSIVELVGYGASDLPNPIPAGVADDPLAFAAGCAPKLPAPRWTERLALDGGAAPALELRPTPALTVRWLEDQCPHLDGALAVEGDCTLTSAECFGQLTQALCGATLDLSSCGIGLGLYSGRVDPQGRFCGEPTPGASCTVQPGAAGESELSCASPADGTACVVTVHTAPPPLPLDVARVELVPPEGAQPPPTLHDLGSLRTLHRFPGRLGGMAALGGDAAGTLAVVARTTPAQLERYCDHATAPTELVFVDRASAAVSFRTPAPPCLSRVAAIDADLYGVIEAPDGPSIARFDARGALTSSAALPLALPARRRYYAPALVTGTPEGLAVVLSWFDPADRSTGKGPAGTVLLAVDRATLASRVLFSTDGDAATDLTFSGGRLALAFDVLDEVMFLDPSTGREARVVNLAAADSTSFGALTSFPGSSRLLVTAPGVNSAIYEVGEDRVITRGEPVYLPRRAALVATPWPPGQEGLLLGLGPRIYSSPPEAAVGLYTPQGRVMPGTLSLGFGAVTNALTLDDEAWLALGWEGSVVRVRAKESP